MAQTLESPKYDAVIDYLYLCQSLLTAAANERLLQVAGIECLRAHFATLPDVALGEKGEKTQIH
jgi:hypothetical protein